eukprot:NODE_45_length_32908_cov_0.790271.p29 type:complete len:122 gc:universal NODE_45_length_32908_cov_0.790271:2128-2493(+)
MQINWIGLNFIVFAIYYLKKEHPSSIVMLFYLTALLSEVVFPKTVKLILFECVLKATHDLSCRVIHPEKSLKWTEIAVKGVDIGNYNGQYITVLCKYGAKTYTRYIELSTAGGFSLLSTPS